MSSIAAVATGSSPAVAAVTVAGAVEAATTAAAQTATAETAAATASTVTLRRTLSGAMAVSVAASEIGGAWGDPTRVCRSPARVQVAQVSSAASEMEGLNRLLKQQMLSPVYNMMQASRVVEITSRSPRPTRPTRPARPVIPGTRSTCTAHAHFCRDRCYSCSSSRHST